MMIANENFIKQFQNLLITAPEEISVTFTENETHKELNPVIITTNRKTFFCV